MKMIKLLPLALIFCLLSTGCSSKNIVSYKSFEKIRPNMKLDQVEKIIGSKGKLLKGEIFSGAIIATIPGEQVYCWINKDQSNLCVALLNGGVIHVSQYDLR